jgi:hypothetical protein
MIAIINETGLADGECTYRLQINRRLLTRFKHHRPDGLAACLRMAADAAERWESDEAVILNTCKRLDRLINGPATATNHKPEASTAARNSPDEAPEG